MSNEIKLYGVIGEDVMAKDVKNAIDAMDQTQPLVVRIHSEGGAVNEGLAIYDAIKAYAGPKRAVIESAAFSIASHIAMAFDDVEITENGYLMIHNPHMEVGGDDVAHAQAAEVLAKLKESMVTAYSQKTGKPREEVLAVMANETWINAREALAGGYVSRIMPPKLKAVAKMKNLPQGVAKSLSGDCSEAGESRKEHEMSETKPVAATLAEIKAALPKAKAEFLLECVERPRPMASVLTDAYAALEEENMALKAKLSEMEAKAATEVSVEPAEEEKMAKATAKSGVKPLAKAVASSRPSALAQWNSLINEEVKIGTPKAKAVMALVRTHPDIHQAMLAEVNS